MDRNERLEMIFSQFDRSAKDFCETTGGLYCDISSSYKGEETPENLAKRLAKIYYHSYIVLFQYTAHVILDVVYSVLDCWIYFGKAATELPIPLPFAVDFCDEDVVEPLCIPFISNEKGMAQAFACIGNTVKRLMPKISAISYDEQQKQAVDTYFFEEYSAITGNSKDEMAIADPYLNWITMRFSSNVYTLAIKGKTEKAAKQLNKLKEKYRYEERLIKLWQSGKTMDSSQISAVAANLEWINDKGVSKTDTKEFLPFFISWIVLTIPAAAVYLGIYFLMILLQQHDSVYLTGVLQNLPYGILAGFLTAIPLSYFTRFWFLRLICKKDYEHILEMDHIASGGGGDRIIKTLLYIIVVVATAFTIFVSTCNLNFKKDGFTDNTGFFSVTGTYYRYQEIDHIQYLPSRVNGFGDTLDFPSYALVMKDGKEIDLYEYDVIENYEPELIPFLQKQGVKVVKNDAVN